MLVILDGLNFKFFSLLFSKHDVFFIHFYNSLDRKITLQLKIFFTLFEIPEVLILHFLDQDFMFFQVLVTALSPLLRAGTLQTDDTISLFLCQDVEMFPAHN